LTTFAELRDIGETLARFASIREKAESPMDRIVVQASDGVLKLVAGNFQSTVIATVGPTEQTGRAVVPARTLLGAIKTLKAKGEADFLIREDGAVIKTGFGSAIEMPGMDMPKYLRPVPQAWEVDDRTVPFDAGFLPAACKYLVPCIGEFSPHNQVVGKANGHSFHFEANDNHMGVEVGPLMATEAYSVHFPGETFGQLRGMDSEGWFWFPPRHKLEAHRAHIYAGKYTVVMVIWPDYPNFPKVAEHDYTVTVKGNKKVLIDTFKALAGRHEFNRVIMEADEGVFTIKGGDSGAAKVDVTCEGRGSLPVNATYLAKVLTTVDGVNATIQYSDAPSLVRVVGDKNPWPIRLAPMK
jgi:hypothetical protein